MAVTHSEDTQDKGQAMSRPVGEDTSGVQVLARAADILRALHDAPAGLTQAEVGERIGLARSTVHRLLNALEEEGLVESSGRRGRYRLGPEIPRLADAAWRGLHTSMHPLLEELSRQVNETVDLSILDGNRVTFVDQVVAARRLRAVSAVGESFPLHCTANGKAFLARMPARELDKILAGTLTSFTPHTMVDPGALRRELDVVRTEGAAYDREEHTEGICAVGTVLTGWSGGPLAVSIPLPAQRFYGRETVLRDALLGWAGPAGAELSEA
jgi:DNA-binding IclR family transcriptional regulator